MPPSNLPLDILVTDLPDGVRFDLPDRKLTGSLRTVGVAFLLVGMAMSCVALVSASFAIYEFTKSHNSSTITGLVFALIVAVPMLAIGALVAGIGLLLIKSRARVEITAQRLCNIERVGPIHWTFRRKTPDIQKLEVRAGSVKITGQPVTTGPLADLSAILVHCRNKPNPMWLAGNYPLTLLQPLADELSRRIDLLSPDATRAPVEVAVNTQPFDLLNPAPAQPDLPIPQPPNSKVLVDRTTAGVTLTLPPAGLVGSAKALATFCVIWLATCALMAIILMITRATLPEFLLLIPFLLIGAGLLFFALNMAKRTAVLDVVGQTLVVTQSTLFKTTQQEWPASAIADVRRGPSGTSINDRPVLCLQIKLATGKTRNLLTGRDESELAWLAYEIRQALNLSRPPVAP